MVKLAENKRMKQACSSVFHLFIRAALLHCLCFDMLGCLKKAHDHQTTGDGRPQALFSVCQVSELHVKSFHLTLKKSCSEFSPGSLTAQTSCDLHRVSHSSELRQNLWLLQLNQVYCRALLHLNHNVSELFYSH